MVVQKLVIYFFKGIDNLYIRFITFIETFITNFKFYVNGVIHSSFSTRGIPVVNIAFGGNCIIGLNFKMNNNVLSNPIGRVDRCCIVVGRKGVLMIGNHVGISSTTIVCHNSIKIGDKVKIGGNVVIYDTDFHSLDPAFRENTGSDISNTKTSPVQIKENAFIGAHTTILKGVTIGKNSIVGACSVVTKSIPDNEIWGGNPAKFIRKL